MRKYFLIIGFILGLNSVTFGHTAYPDTVVCPVCEDSVVFYMTMSMTSFGGYMDFQEKGAIGSYYEEMINSCGQCFYSGYNSDFDTTYTESFQDSIKLITSNYKGKEIDDALECEIAAEIKKMSEFECNKIAVIYLVGSYLLRADSLEIERRKRMQNLTAEYLIKAIEDDEYEENVVASMNYLIGEMYRRTGNFDKAVVFFNMAIDDEEKQDWVKEVAIKQKELAIEGDDNNDI